MLLFLAADVTSKSYWLRLLSLHAPAFNAILRDKLIQDVFFATCRLCQFSCLFFSISLRFFVKWKKRRVLPPQPARLLLWLVALALQRP